MGSSNEHVIACTVLLRCLLVPSPTVRAVGGKKLRMNEQFSRIVSCVPSAFVPCSGDTCFLPLLSLRVGDCWTGLASGNDATK